MSNDSGPTQFSESPASWNTRYLDPSGFECQLTLRAENGKDLLEKATNVISFLLANSCKPAIYFRNGTYKSENKNNEQRISNESNGENHNVDHTTFASWCPIHNVEMKKWTKNGKIWYSHKSVDGWCSGKPKNGSQK